MKTVYKYPLSSPDTMLAIPKGATVLHVEPQGTKLCLWALVDPDESTMDRRRFVTIGTGHPIPDADTLTHLTTFLDGPFVWHIFESSAR